MHKKLTNNPNFAITVLLVLAAIVLGYAAMWIFGYYSPTESAFSAIVIQLTLIALAFGIAYAILKGIFHYMRMKDPHERELRLKDLPKDAPQNEVRHS